MRVQKDITCTKWYLRIAFPLFLAVSISGCAENTDNQNTTYIYPSWLNHVGFAQFGSFDLRLFLGNKTRFDNPQGMTVFVPVGEKYPVCVWVNSGQNAIVYNRSHFSLDRNGFKTPLSLQVSGKNFPIEGKMKIPWGITSDKHGNFYVVDRGNSRVLKLSYANRDPQDGDLTVSHQIGSPGSDPGDFLDPRGVAMVGIGLIAVVDNSLNRVTILNDSGDVQRYWEGLNEPLSIASSYATSQSAGEDSLSDFLIVVDSLDRRVTKFDYEGNILAQSDAMKWNPPLTPELNFIAIDRFHQILITDRNNNCIHKLDRDLNYLTRFGQSGNDDYQFDQPRGIAIEPESGRLMVVERERLQIFLVAVEVPKFDIVVISDSTWRDLQVNFRTTEQALVDFDLLNEYGQFVARLIESKLYPAGENHLSWGMSIPKTLPDGRPLPALPPPCQAGEKLPEGKYRIKGTFRATYGSKDVFVKEKSAEFDLKW